MHYLDNAATSHPKPASVVDAVSRCVVSPGNPGRGASRATIAASELLERCRREVAAFLGAADPRRLAFTLNATDGLNLAISSLVGPRQRVVVSGFEHAAVMRPLRRLERDAGVEVRTLVPTDGVRLDPDEVLAAAQDAVLVAVTCASNVTGAAQPWREIAKALAASATPLLLDAAQAAGSLPIAFDDLGPHVALAFTGHKALLGPMGVGGILVGEGLALGPWREGGTGDSLDELQPRAMPRRLEAGTPPLPAIAGLAAGVAWWRQAGVDVVRAREAGLIGQLVRGLVAIDGVEIARPASQDETGDRAPIVSFTVRGWSVDEVALALESDFDVIVRAGLHCAPAAHRLLGTHPEGTVRASIGPTTTEKDVQALLDGVAALAQAS